jgi:hypothetical protein
MTNSCERLSRFAVRKPRERIGAGKHHERNRCAQYRYDVEEKDERRRADSEALHAITGNAHDGCRKRKALAPRARRPRKTAASAIIANAMQ